MAERIVSPGVFTQERDLSFLPQGVAEIGAAFVGPTVKGPAFIPTQVEGIDGFVTTFGQPEGISYMGYSVKNYLQEAGSATVVRVLGLAGYETNVATVYVTGSAGRRLLAILHPTVEGVSISGVSASGAPTAFSLRVTGSSGATSSFSGLTATEASADFISKVLGADPLSLATVPSYVYAVFPNAVAQAGATPTVVAETASLSLLKSYDNARTPWIQSQPISGAPINLFKIHTLSDGVSSNAEIKVSITGITAPNTASNANAYGTFSLLVRKIDDTDTSLNVLEEFSNLTLDPDSPNFIARRIGDSAPIKSTDPLVENYYEGDFPNLSKYIRVEMSTEIIPNSAVPYGYGNLLAPIGITATNIPTGSAITSRWVTGSQTVWSTDAVDRRLFYGFNLSDRSSLSYLLPTVGTGTEVTGTSFNIATSLTSISTEVAGSPLTLTDKTQVGYRRFTVPLQGGFDGFKPNRQIALGADITDDNTQGFDLSTATTSGSVEFTKGLTALSNPDSVDFNLLVIPGVIQTLHSQVAQKAIDLCETRGDAFFILDLAPLNASIAEVTQAAELLDTNYAAGYYPWVRVLDSDTNKYIWAPPSVVLPEVYAYNDRVGAEWFAVAGLNRGGIPGAVGVKSRLSQNDRDTLYESKVNPIAQFPGQGISVWGQKTLQTRASALDRINVRRLLITVKKFIASSARYLVFEQNTETTRNRFLNIVNPYLAGIQQRSGLTAFRVVMDETNNTPDIIDRNILRGAIYLQPTRTAEFIQLDFNILPTGASFDTI